MINPGAGHAHARAGSPTRNAIDAFLEQHLSQGKIVPDRVQFVTYTTRYNRSFRVTIDSMEQHFSRAMVDATRNRSKSSFFIKTSNVSRLILSDAASARSVTIDGSAITFTAGPVLGFQKSNDTWEAYDPSVPAPLRKRHGLQGLINDAFFDSFLCVAPTGEPANVIVKTYTKNELDRFARTFAKEYRGEVRMKPDSLVTDKNIAENNLVLFGDPTNNSLIARIADQLPVHWTRHSITVGGKTYSSGEHIPS